MGNFDIFISYSSKDKLLADQVVSHIEEAGFSCWIAPRNIEGGAEYSEIIEKAILECKIFLLIFSEDSEKSPWVKSELNIAFSENKYLLPYKIDATPLKGTMRLLLNDKHWIERGSDESKQFDLLVSAVQNYFALLAKGEIDEVSNNNYYANIAKNRKRKKIFLGISVIVILIAVAAIFSGNQYFKNKKNIKLYQDILEQAFSIDETTVNNIVNKRNILAEARDMENTIPVSHRKNLADQLFQLDFKIDSIYSTNLESARWFAKAETKHGDKQAMECYKVALQAKEDSVARRELSAIIARKDNYE